MENRACSGSAAEASQKYPPHDIGCGDLRLWTACRRKEDKMFDPERDVGALIDGAEFSLIGSVDPQGFPNIKAMLAPRSRQGIRTLLFTTNTSSMRVAQYLEEPRACIYFFDGVSFRGAMLRGTMEVLRDEETRKAIWRDGDERYYAKGVDDPDYCVLRFTAIDGRYYGSFRSESFSVEA